MRTECCCMQGSPWNFVFGACFIFPSCSGAELRGPCVNWGGTISTAFPFSGVSVNRVSCPYPSCSYFRNSQRYGAKSPWTKVRCSINRSMRRIENVLAHAFMTNFLSEGLCDVSLFTFFKTHFSTFHSSTRHNDGRITKNRSEGGTIMLCSWKKNL